MTWPRSHYFRTRGAVCVFPQDKEHPIWVPERLTRKFLILKEIGQPRQSSFPESCYSRLSNSVALDSTLSPWVTSPPGSPMPSPLLRSGQEFWPGEQWSLGCVFCVWQTRPKTRGPSGDRVTLGWVRL